MKNIRQILALAFLCLVATIDRLADAQCTSDSCQNGATCDNSGGPVVCTCVAGYTGATCETNIDECTPMPCQNGGTCLDEVNGYQCQCAEGYTGVDCETDIDECASNPCWNGGSCTEGSPGFYNCSCVAGYTGTSCATNVDECASMPCQNGGMCMDEVNAFECQCAGGYTGVQCETDIDECTSMPCLNGGSCTEDSLAGYYRCDCVAGYTGADCETNVINECTSIPCRNGGTCVDEVNGYQCQCAGGYTGEQCETNIDECVSMPCQNGGTCTDEINGHQCQCAEGYTGADCETDIDECASKPCLNGGSCTEGSLAGFYNCTCVAGYTGTSCATNVDECASMPCQNGGMCMDEVNAFECQCAGGYTGVQCETDIDECTSMPCLNGGSCMEDSLAGYYKCNCVPGYTGADCETNVDECASMPCQNGGNCTDEVNQYQCICPAGFTGLSCETNVDECSSSPCQNDGTCTDQINQYQCGCVSGYTGDVCETNVNECASQPCQNGGTCIDAIDGYSCSCVTGYMGTECGADVNECIPTSPCDSNANCDNSIGSFTCTCNPGYSGDGLNCTLLAPLPVENLVVTDTQPTNVSLSWSNPNPAGIVITYSVSYVGSSASPVMVSSTSAVITGLKPFLNYNFSVVAKNQAGPSDSRSVAAQTNESAPTKVRNLEFTERNASSISLQWAEPQPANGLIRSYRVVYSSSSSLKQEKIVTTPQIILTGLTPFTFYDISVSARTVDEGPSMSIRVQTVEDAPSAPVGLNVTVVSSTALSITWDEPLQPNGILEGYYVSYFETALSDSEMTTVNVSNETYLASPLKKYTLYTVRVRAFLTSGLTLLEGNKAEKEQRTGQDVPEGKPLRLTATADSSSSILLRWAEPQESLRNGIITEYKIVYSANQSNQSFSPVMTSGTTRRIMGLTPFSSYCFDVAARTNHTPVSGDAFGPSARACETTQQDKPSSPINVVISQGGSTITVRWNEPTTKNGIISRYNIYYRSLDGGNEMVQSVSGSLTSFSVNGLTPFTNYSFEVSAFTDSNRFEGNRSDVKIFETSESTPTVPLSFSVNNITAKTATFTWAEPATTNGIIIGYTLRIEDQTPPGVSITNFPLGPNDHRYVATNLNEYTNYFAYVSASTSAGPGDLAQTNLFTTLQAAPNIGPTLQPLTATSDSITASWNPLSMDDVNGRLAGYQIYLRENATGVVIANRTLPESNTTFNQSGLKAFTFYEFKVAVESGGGVGPATTDAVRTAEAQPAGVPSSVVLTPLPRTPSLQKSIRVQWGPIVNVADRNGIVTSYNVTVIDVDLGTVNSQSVLVGNGSSPYQFQVNGLESFIVYSVQVAASNGAGQGPFSAPKQVTTVEDKPQASPQNLATVVQSSTVIDFSWDLPPKRQRSGVIQNYTVNVTGSEVTTSFPGIMTTNFTANQLKPFTWYTFSVAALTSVGSGPSASTVARTDESVPANSPTGLYAMNKTTSVGLDASVTLTWRAPSTPNGLLTVYEVRVYINGGGLFLGGNTTGNETQFLVTGLQKYTSYLAEVAAFTAVGRGPFSNRIRFLTDQDVPEAPTSFDFVNGSNTAESVTVVWTPPLDNNGFRIGYTLSFTKGVYMASTTALISDENLPPPITNIPSASTSLNLIGLHPSSQYTLTLSARTAKGPGDPIELNVQTLEAAPSAPVLFDFSNNVRDVTTSRVTLVWYSLSPAQQNGVIVKYRLRYRRPVRVTNEDGTIPFPVEMEIMDVTTLRLELMNLDSFANYVFDMSACTAQGCGPPASKTMRTAASLPGPVNIAKVDTTSTTVTITWDTLPMDEWNDARITDYKVRLQQGGNDVNPNNQSVPYPGTTYSATGLEEHEQYRVVVLAQNSVGFGTEVEASQRIFRTEEDTPGPPSGVTSEVVAKKLTLTWGAPSDPNGVITGYKILYTVTKTYNDETGRQIQLNRTDSLTTDGSARQREIVNIVGDSSYTLRVQGKTSVGYGQFSPSVVVNVPILAPAETPPLPLSPPAATPEPTKTTFDAVIVPFSNLNGAILRYAVIVLEDTDETLSDAEKQATPISYQQLSAATVKRPFYAYFGTAKGLRNVTLSSARRRRRETTASHGYLFTVGSDSSCLTTNQLVCNGELTPDTSYRYKVRGYTQLDSDPSNPQSSDVLYSETDYSVVYTTKSPGLSGGAIAAIVIVVLVAIAVGVILGVLYYRRRRTRKETFIDMSAQVSNADLRRPSFVKRNPGALDGRQRLHSLHPLRTHPKLSRPVSISHFSKHVVQMSADSDFKFSEEFETVQGVGLEGTTEASLCDENRPKNRYTNILAYDHSRVKLSFTDDEPGSDYINANYIHGYNLPRSYVATQGPLPGTFDDFWRMVWEQNAGTIVMLTQLEEKGRTKCHRYWPDEEEDAQTYGDLVIKMLSEKVNDDWTLREFSVQCYKEVRTVRQFQFTTWPDMGVPADPKTIIGFVRTVRAQQVADAGPMTIHCSAGVGRTGTFIALDMILRRVREKDTVDVFGVVCSMRLQRNHMVQTEAQYVFIHKAVLEIIQNLQQYKMSTTPQVLRSNKSNIDQEESHYVNLSESKM